MEELLRLVCLLIITAGLFLFLWTTKSFWLPFAARWLMVGDKDLHPADVIIILSGEQGELVATGVKLYQEGLALRLLMTSGPVKWKRNERPGGEQIRRDPAAWQGQLGKIG
ncbi:hypothetical protein SEF58_09020 [Neomoorella humiferrea]